MEKFFANLLESTIDTELLQIKNVSILGKASKNNRDYTDNALSDGARLFEGIPAYANHRSNGKRDVREIIGSFVNVRKENDRVKADLQVLKKESWLLEVAEKMPRAMGFSIDATAKVRRVSGREVVEGITAVTSVDLVDSPATVKGLFESENFMEEKEILEMQARLETKEKEIEIKEAEINEREAQIEAKEKKIDRNLAIREKVEKSLPKELITDSFLRSVQGIEDDNMVDALIADRKHVWEVAKKPSGRDNTMPSPTTKQTKEEIKLQLMKGK